MRYIPLAVPNFKGNELKYVTEAVRQEWVSTGGAYITQLEEQMASFLHVERCVACQSGTAGIHLSLIQCGIQPGDAVIVPTLTFIAAVNPVKYQFATPIFMDCDEGLTMDPEKLRAYCETECELKDNKLYQKETGRQVKAVIVVHVFGNMADMEAIMEIGDQYHLRVIEDATEALGTKYTEGKFKGKYAGTIGDFGAFSYNGNKIITTGGGGMITARNPEELEHMKYLSTQAKDDHLFYIHNEIGYNYRMTNIQAALGVAQMEELETFIQKKKDHFHQYQILLQDVSKVKLKSYREGTSSNCWFYALEICMEQSGKSIREIVEQLDERGIGTRPIWGLIHQQRPYQQEKAYQIERAVHFAKCILNIPCSTNLNSEEIRETVENIQEVL